MKTRMILGAVSAVALSTVAAHAGEYDFPDLDGKQVTVVSWGGAYTKSQVEAYHKPFIAGSKAKIISEDYNGGLAEIKAQVEAGNVTWDIVDVELSDAVRACDEGLAETDRQVRSARWRRRHASAWTISSRARSIRMCGPDDRLVDDLRL